MLSYLTSQFGAIAADQNFAQTDTAAGYGSVLDDALLEYGVAYATLSTAEIPDAEVNRFNKLLRYFALLKFLAGKAPSVRLKTEAPEPLAYREQAWEHLNAMLKDAKAQAQAEGFLTEAKVDEQQIGWAVFPIDAAEPPPEGL